MFKKGAAVKQIMPAPIEGVVDSFSVDQINGTVQVKVVWEDSAGQHEHFFNETEIEAV